MSKFPATLLWAHSHNLGVAFDIDTLTGSSGVYEVTDPGGGDAPDTGHGFLFVIAGGSGRAMQQWFGQGDGEPAWRYFDGSSWSNWSWLALD